MKIVGVAYESEVSLFS